MHDFPRIGFIGGGNMAGALIEGLLERGCKPARLTVVEVSEQAREKWRARGLQVVEQPSDVLRQCDVWLLAVKPQQLHPVVISARSFLQDGTLVISIAAGIALSSLSQWLGTQGSPWPAVIRAMPNTPALVGQGVTGLAAVAGVRQEQREMAQQILGSVGEVVWVKDDAQIDAVTALSGSGPAYVFRFIEGLIAGGQALGLDPQQARVLALNTVSGSATLAARSNEPVEVLRDRVTSKGGTTAAALDVMHEQAFYETVVKAMQAAYERAGELSAEFGKTPM